VKRTCPDCRHVVDNEGPCSFCATACWFCDQPRDQHEPDCMGGQVERDMLEHDEHLRAEGRKAALAEVATHLELVAWACAAAAQPLPRGTEKVALAAMAVVLRGHALSVSDGVLLSRTPDGRVTAPGCEPMSLEAVGQAMRSAVSPPKEGT
jgi:hypothetical protein